MKKLFLIATLITATVLGGCKKHSETPKEEETKITGEVGDPIAPLGKFLVDYTNDGNNATYHLGEFIAWNNSAAAPSYYEIYARYLASNSFRVVQIRLKEKPTSTKTYEAAPAKSPSEYKAGKAYVAALDVVNIGHLYSEANGGLVKIVIDGTTATVIFNNLKLQRYTDSNTIIV